MIELKNISVIYNEGTQLENCVLKEINLKVYEGEFVTIIGGNGAGKSTLMNIVSGDIVPNKGCICINEKNVTTLRTENRSPMVARVFQDPISGTFADLTIEENMSLAYKRGQNRGLSLSINNHLREDFKNALAQINIGLEDRLKDRVEYLSGGQRQALSLIMTTLQESKILLLDEHTAALDPKMASIIMDLTNKIIKQKKLTALMITHCMSQALKYGNRTILMNHGKIIKDVQGDKRLKLSTDDLIKYFDLV